jgi:hypothetical protein
VTGGGSARPPDKVCGTCGRYFSWRRKWAARWDGVRYCSAACRRGPGHEGRALEADILALLEARRAGATVCPSEIARARYPHAWREHMEAVRRAARRLAHRGEIDITQSGRPVDPADFVGAIRLRRKGIP